VEKTPSLPARLRVPLKEQGEPPNVIIQYRNRENKNVSIYCTGIKKCKAMSQRPVYLGAYLGVVSLYI